MFRTKNLWPLLIILFLAGACKKDPRPIVDPKEVTGLYIVNEGGFLQGNASLSFYDAEQDIMYDDIFAEVNGRPLGDVFQSMTFYKGKAYLVVNNSQKIEVVDSASFTSLNTITGLDAPRNIFFLNDKAYITSFSGIAVYNAETFQKIKDIDVGGWPEKLVLHDTTLYAPVQQFSYGPGARKGLVSISPRTDEVLQYMELREGAYDIVLDANNWLWVMCAGDFNVPVNGALYKVDPKEFELLTEYPFGGLAYFGNALKLSNNGLQLYFAVPNPAGGFTQTDIYRMNIFSNTLPSAPLFSGAGKYVYGFGVDELQGELYVLDAVQGGQKGNLIRVNLDNGQEISTYGVGYFPNNVIVRR
jgi:hypothetical protein